MIREVTHAYLGPIGYHSEPSDVPYSPNQFLGWDLFCQLLQKAAPFIWFQTHSISAHLKKDFRPTTINFWETFVQGGPNVLEPNVLGPIVFGTK